MQDALDQKDVTQDDEADSVPDVESVVRRLPFGFSKRFGVLVVPGTSNPVELLYREDASMQSLLEARRVVAQPVVFKKTDVESFNAQLARAHENNSGEAMQMVEDLGEELDLSSLADSVPDTGDL